ncbi:MAG: NosD domain-containing protein, partial [Candidatus Thorarchaeota archaeon]
NGTELVDNRLNQTDYAMYMSSDIDSILTNNTFYNNSYGIYAVSSHSSLILNNSFTDNSDYGIYLKTSNSCVVDSNTVSYCRTGVYFRSSNNLTLSNSTLVGNGLRLNSDTDAMEEWNHTIKTNTVNGKPLGYFWDLSDTNIPGGLFGQIVLGNCRNVSVNDGAFPESSYGILIGYSQNCTVASASVSYCLEGVLLDSCVDIIIKDSIFHNNSLGGIRTFFTNYSHFENNTIRDSEFYGINLLSSNNCTIVWNGVYDSGLTGIALQDIPTRGVSSNNTIYGNEFAWSSSSNGQDWGSDNTWDDGLSIGNGWSDYGGVGFYVPLSSSNVDHYPYNVLSLDSPNDIVYIEGTSGHIINWTAYAQYPGVFEIKRDSVVMESGPWNGSDIPFFVDGWSIGVYNITLIVTHKTGHSLTDIVFVSVTDFIYTPHGPISISSDSQFSSMAASEGWSGTGSPSNPYLIEGYSISTSSNCISIRDVSVSFTIQRCILSSTVNEGVSLSNVQDAAIRNSSINARGFGVFLYASADVLVANNNISAEYRGLYIWSSTNITSLNNRMLNCSLVIEGYTIDEWNHTFSGNFVNGRPLGYFSELSDSEIDISAYGQVVLALCHNLTVFDGNIYDVDVGVLIGHSSNCSVRDSAIHDVYMGISALFSDGTKIINNEVFDGIDWGIHINMSTYCRVSDNLVHNSGWAGIISGSCANSTIHNNTVHGQNDGIIVWDSFNCDLTNNTVHNNTNGMSFWGNSWCTIVNNTIHSNTFRGLDVGFSFYNVFYENRFRYNGEDANDDDGINDWDDGIGLGNQWSSYNGSGWYYVPGTSNSIDHYPDTLPDIESPQLDHPGDISFYDGSVGNSVTWHPFDANPLFFEIYVDQVLQTWGMWNSSSELISYNLDFLSTGSHNVTIIVGDTFAHNSTDTVQVDVFLDDISPTIDHPSDIIMYEGESWHVITWTPWDHAPYYYEIWQNSTLFKEGFWNSTSETISIELDFLLLGFYDFTITVTDGSGNNATDIVSVTVYEGDLIPPIIDGPSDITYYEGATGNVITWHAFDLNPEYYEIFRNGSFIKWGWWNETSENISINVDGLAIGVYEYLITVSDLFHNTTDIVMVIVLEGDLLSPTVSHPPDINYFEGYTGNLIIWTASDLNPDHYQVFHNGTLVEEGTWSSSTSIEFSVDDLSLGLHNLTLVVSDTFENVASDTVLVRVRDGTPPT